MIEEKDIHLSFEYINNGCMYIKWLYPVMLGGLNPILNISAASKNGKEEASGSFMLGTTAPEQTEA